ncbi:MAG: hypothetical protein IPH12_18665 [Saprospirales bacterium]|nr:hypothetical protein [Saprospirales bacterium]
MPINPIQTIGQIRAQYDFANLTVRLAGVDITGALREIGDAGGNTVEEAELQFPAGSRIALAMNGGRIVPKTSRFRAGPQKASRLSTTCFGRHRGWQPMIVEVSLQFRFSHFHQKTTGSRLCPRLLSPLTGSGAYDRGWLVNSCGAATSSMVFKPITPWITNGISL